MKVCEICNGTNMERYKKDEKEYFRPCSCQHEISKTKYIPKQYQVEWNPAGYKRDWIKIGNEFLKDKDARTLLIWGKTRIGKTFFAYWAMSEFAKVNRYRFGLTNCIRATKLQQIFHLITYGGIEKTDYCMQYEKLVDSSFLIIDDFWNTPKVKTENFIGEFEEFWDSLRADKIIITINDNPDITKDDYGNVITGSLEENYPTTHDRFAETGSIYKAIWYQMIKEMTGPDRRLK
jgi:hypothetical protein